MGDRSYRIEPVSCRGSVVSNHEKAFLFFDDTHDLLYYVPFRILVDWKFLGKNSSPDLSLRDLGPDDPLEIQVPFWLLEKAEKENA